jgi:hypothetical protein
MRHSNASRVNLAKRRLNDAVAADFSSALSLLRWAREDIQDLEAATKGFLDSCPYTFFHEADPDSKNPFLKARMAEVPDEICKLASHALWDIKHALDHAVCAAVRAIRGPEIPDLHFPVANHPNDLEAKLRHIPKGETLPRYPVELHNFFRACEPYPTSDTYPGGGDEFVTLNKLANTTKHAVALGANARPILAGLSSTSMGGLIKVYLDRWDSAKQELTIGNALPGVQYKVNIQLACFVGFRDVDLLDGHAAGEVLEAYATCAETIVSDLTALVS